MAHEPELNSLEDCEYYTDILCDTERCLDDMARAYYQMPNPELPQELQDNLYELEGLLSLCSELLEDVYADLDERKEELLKLEEQDNEEQDV